MFQLDISLKGDGDSGGSFRSGGEIVGTEFDPIPFDPAPVADVPDEVGVVRSPFGKYIAVFRLDKGAGVRVEDIDVEASLILKVKRRSVKLADDADLTPFTRPVPNDDTKALVIVGTNDEALKEKFVFVVAKIPLQDKAGVAVGQLKQNPKHQP